VADPADDPGLFDERELVEQARTDANAFAEIYRQHVDAIHRFAYRRCGDRELAEDVTAATFERALARLDRFRWRPGGIAPWLFRIAGNELTDHRRRQGRRRGDRTRRAADRMQDTVAVDDLDRADNADQLVLLRTALDHEEAARAMGVTPSLMAVLVHRATAALRRSMQRLEEDS
jgi:RNA polymerase sigma-70 factor, ECF subfamily